jgi:hypothetical protein
MNLDLFEEDVLEKIEQADLNAALEQVKNLVQLVIRDPQSVANVFGSERLDRLCLAIGQAFVGNVKKSTTPREELGQKDKYVVTIATELGTYGGHTRVIEDIIKAQPEKLHIILLTDMFNRVDIAGLTEWFQPIAELKVAPVGSALEKLEWLIMQLDAIRPARIFLFNHHEDAVAISAMQPWLGSTKVIFYHHADHHLSLGVHLPEAIHIDPHNLGFYNCRTHERLKDNYYLPLIVEEQEPRSADFVFLKDGNLRTCTSGTYIKFDPTYMYPYGKLISKRLASCQGFHFHIGNLPDVMLASIHNQLRNDGVDVSRFIHIPWVKSVWTSLIEHQVDLYISSFPIGGGRASIEAMGSGTPMLMHEGSTSHFLGGVDLVYPEALVWKKPVDFCEQLLSLTPQMLAEHSHHARRYYQRYHLPNLMSIGLNNICSGTGCSEPPPLRPYEPDYLQKYLQFNVNGESKRDIYNAQLQEKDELIQFVMNSWSWKITRPFRWAVRHLAGLASGKS